ncbi:bacteriophage protein [Pantoea stewartii]|uniref:Bacteriophage protein n=2 Tax=Pantoea stewartii subsp. stewartii DC283 TaxID=660596 RepID=A0ABM6KBH0_PANSE|nr:bacteriophage protein [Pantoea stewartii]ARF51886.1 hypothetical protein DSJ_09900 [Pantoea stewartii subsp. stewartii DC283]KAB0560016.1 hypothetical protein F7Q90_00920 [Pantoea stewartii subsp. stewartii]
MVINSGLLRAALVCVARKDPRYYLEGVHITPQYLEATNGHVALRMEHGFKTNKDVIVWFGGAVPARAETTEIHFSKEPYAVHRDEAGERIGFTVIKILEGRFPDMDRVIPKSVDENATPALSAHYLSYPLKMFGKGSDLIRIRLAPSGETTACRLMFDRSVMEKFGNAQFVVMPMRYSIEDFPEVKA